MSEPGAILYLGGTLPTLSETFVTRELLGLRRRGLRVLAASVHPPQRDLADPELRRLADEALPVYGRGPARLLADAAREALAHPARAAGTLARAAADALAGRDVATARRPRVLWQALAALALARRARPLGIGHIHAHMAHVPATIAMYAARQLGVPFSFTGHAVDLFRERTLLSEKLRRAAFAACISRWHRDLYRSLADLPDERLPIVRCGVEPEAPAAGSLASGDGRTILAAGRLVPKKGFDLLLRAIARLRDEGAPPAAAIIGDGPERAALRRLSSRLGLGEHIRWLGALDNRHVRAHMRSCDLFVLPCRVDPTGDRDGIPVVLMEAMAAGACVVAGDLPAIRELVVPGATGVLVPPEDADALAAALRELIADPARRRALGEAGRHHVLDEFSLERNLDRMQRALVRWPAAARREEPGALTTPEPATEPRATPQTPHPALAK